MWYLVMKMNNIKMHYLIGLMVAFNCGICLVAFLGFNLIFIISTFCGLSSCILFNIFYKKIKFKSILVCSTAFLFGTIWFYGRELFFKQNASKLNNKIAVVSAEVIDERDQNFFSQNRSYLLKINQINKNNVFLPLKFRVFSKYFKFKPGYKIKALIHFKTTTEKNQNFQFSSNRANEVYLNGKILNLFTEEESNSLVYQFSKVRSKLIQALNLFMTEPNNFLASSIFLGKTSNLPYNLRRSFSRCGLAHLFAVSGLHITILFAILLNMLQFLRISKKFSFFIVLIVSVAYLGLIGFCISAVRASLMNLAYLLGSIFKRNFKSIHLLCFAATLILIITPNAIFSLSFVLSILSCLGISLIFKPLSFEIRRRLFIFSGWLKLVVDSISISISSLLFSSIILALVFHQISIVSPIVNLIVLPLIPFVLIGSALTAISGLFGCNLIASVCSYFCEGVFFEIVALVEFISKFSFCCIPLRYFVAPLIILGLISFWIFVFFYYREILFSKLVLILSLLIIGLPILNHLLIYSESSCVSFIGNKFSKTVIINSMGATIVLNCGGYAGCEQQLCNFLDSRGIRKIDFLIFLSTQNRFMNCDLLSIVNCVDIHYVMVPSFLDDEYLEKQLIEKNVTLITIDESHFVNFPLSIDFLRHNRKQEFNCFLTVGDLSFAWCFTKKELKKMQNMKLINFAMIDEVVDELDFKLKCGFLVLLQPSSLQLDNVAQIENKPLEEFLISGSFLNKDGL